MGRGGRKGEVGEVRTAVPVPAAIGSSTSGVSNLSCRGTEPKRGVWGRGVVSKKSDGLNRLSLGAANGFSGLPVGEKRDEAKGSFPGDLRRRTPGVDDLARGDTKAEESPGLNWPLSLAEVGELKLSEIGNSLNEKPPNSVSTGEMGSAFRRC